MGEGQPEGQRHRGRGRQVASRLCRSGRATSSLRRTENVWSNPLRAPPRRRRRKSSRLPKPTTAPTKHPRALPRHLILLENVSSLRTSTLSQTSVPGNPHLSSPLPLPVLSSNYPPLPLLPPRPRFPRQKLTPLSLHRPQRLTPSDSWPLAGKQSWSRAFSWRARRGPTARCVQRKGSTSGGWKKER